MNKPVVIPGQPATMRELLLRDRKPVRDLLLDDQNDYLDDPCVGFDRQRYISQDFHRLEVERMWTKVWQVACREEEVPTVGDYILYEIADKSVIVVRSAENEIRAFFNACPHRARMVCNTDGHAAHFRCPFHGMMWKLDGTLRHLPFRWDFPGIKDEDVGLAPVKVGTWGGFVFINMDPNSMSLEDYLTDFPQQANAWEFENRYIKAHVGQIIRANWKVSMEAFLEDYHLMATHPQALPFVAWGMAQYTARKDHPHYSRLLFPLAVPSPTLHTNEAQTLAAMCEKVLCLPGEEEDWVLPEGMTARERAADILRKRQSKMAGKDFSNVSDTETLDSWVYPIFPNIFIWGAFSRLFYRFRPWNNDPEMSLMEIYFILPCPEGRPRPKAATMTLLGPDQKFSDAPEMANGAASIFDQDLDNIEWVQRGLHSMPRQNTILSRYQESQIRHFHRTLDMYVSGNPPTASLQLTLTRSIRTYNA